MATQPVVGTPLIVTLDGDSFFPASDSDITDGTPATSKEYLRSTARTFFRYSARETTATVTLKVDEDELDKLKTLAERTDSFAMSYTHANGVGYKATGRIQYDTRSGNSGDVEIQMTPDTDWVRL